MAYKKKRTVAKTYRRHQCVLAPAEHVIDERKRLGVVLKLEHAHEAERAGERIVVGHPVVSPVDLEPERQEGQHVGYSEEGS